MDHTLRTADLVPFYRQGNLGSIRLSQAQSSVPKQLRGEGSCGCTYNKERAGGSPLSQVPRLGMLRGGVG